MSFSRLLIAPVILSALLVGAGSTASAQCFGGDQLDVGPCCGPAIPNLPVFSTVSMPGLGACWDRCTQGLQRTLKVSWTAPAMSACSEYSSQLFVADGVSGMPLLSGKMVLNYTRTWLEIDPAGVMTQVWRFTAKADLSFVPGGLAVNCPVPPCIAPFGPHPTAFYYGYVDYAGCAAGGFQNTIVLYHATDRFIHAPGLSDKPGVFHPGQAYAIIAPHSAVQTFIPGNNIAFGGPLVGEATRDVNVPGIPPTICTVEDRVLSGTMLKLGAGCLATTLMPNPKANTLRQFSGKTNCVNAAGLNGNWTSLNVNFPTLPWFHMVTSSIGRWANPNIYPGTEAAWVDEGLFIHQTACTGDVVELKYGGSTQGGFTAILPIPAVVTNFTDIADNYTAPLFGPYPLPIMGSIQQTEHLIYVNEP